MGSCGGSERLVTASHDSNMIESPELSSLPPECAGLSGLPKLVGQIVSKPLLKGNRVVPLVNGDEAYPAMIQAINSAQASVTLSTYIFDNDPVGRRFAQPRHRLRERGRGVEPEGRQTDHLRTPADASTPASALRDDLRAGSFDARPSPPSQGGVTSSGSGQATSGNAAGP